MGEYKIIFKGEPYLLIGDKNDGAIATQEQWDNFALNYAHLYDDGKVRRYSSVIGTKEDIVYLDQLGE